MLIKQTLQYLPAQILGPLAQFAAILIWTHVASPETIGAVTLIVSAQELLNGLLLGWWSHFSMRFYGRFVSEKRLDDYGSTTLWVLAGIVVLLVPLTIANALLFIDKNFGVGFCTLLGAYAVLRTTNQYSATISATKTDVLTTSILTISGPVFGLFIGWFLLVRYGSSPFWPILGYAIGEGLGRLLATLRTRVSQSETPLPKMQLPSKDIVKAAWLYGSPLLMGWGFTWCSLNLPRYFVGYFDGIAALGIFSVGYGLGQRAASILGSLVTAAGLPLIFKKLHGAGRDSAMEQLARNGALVIAALLPSLVGLWLVSSQLVKLAVPKAYWSSTITILPWSAFAGGSAAYVSNYLTHVFLLDGATRTALIADMADAVVVSLTALICTLMWGPIGTAVGIAIPKVIGAAALTLYLRLRRGLIFPTADTIRIAASVALMTVVVLLIPDAANWRSLIARISVGVVVYSAALAFMFRRELKARFPIIGVLQSTLFQRAKSTLRRP